MSAVRLNTGSTTKSKKRFAVSNWVRMGGRGSTFGNTRKSQRMPLYVRGRHRGFGGNSFHFSHQRCAYDACEEVASVPQLVENTNVSINAAARRWAIEGSNTTAAPAPKSDVRVFRLRTLGAAMSSAPVRATAGSLFTGGKT